MYDLTSEFNISEYAFIGVDGFGRKTYEKDGHIYKLLESGELDKWM